MILNIQILLLTVTLISIIIPTYNSESTIELAIQSIIEQSINDLELIIVDGKSSDKTMNIVHKYAESDKRIMYLSEKDNGIYDAMNKGIEIANGDWIYFLGSDDTLYCTKTLHQIFSQDLTEFDILWGEVNEVSRGIYKPKSIAPDHLIFDSLNHQGVIIRTKFVASHPFKTKYNVFADQVQFFEIIQSGARTAFCNITFANYSMTGYSSANIDLNYSKDKLSIIRKTFGQVVPEKLLFRAVKNQAFDQIKFINPLRGLWWLYQGGLVFGKWKDILYCFKVRFYHRVLNSKKFR